MATRKQLTSRCRELGVYLFDDGIGDGTLLVEIPAGKTCGGLHGLVAEYGYGATKSEAYADLLDRLSDGLEACREHQCENCEEPIDPDQYAADFRTQRVV